MVADGNRIGGADSLEPEIPFDFATDVLSVFGVDEVVASGIFYDDSFH